MNDDFILEDFKKYIFSIISFCDKTNKVKSTFFLNEIECHIAKVILNKQKNVNYMFLGGFLNATRNILVIYSNSLDLDVNSFKPTIVVSKYNKMSHIKHSTVLGSLMSLNIKRGLIGDVFIDENENKVYIACHSNAIKIVCDELKKVGGAGVLFTSLTDGVNVSTTVGISLHTFVVASKRLDVVVSAITGSSRSVASQIVKQGRVFLNYEEMYKDIILIKNNDIITIRGYGKFVVSDIDRMSKKGRIILEVKKYI